MLIRLLTAHPASVGESYFDHLRFAWRFGGTMLVGGIACMLHGLLPFLFTTGGSRRVRTLHATLQGHAARRVPPPAHDQGMGGESLYNWSI